MFRLLLSHLPGELNLIKLLNMTFLYVGSWSISTCCYVPVLWLRCASCSGSVLTEPEQEAQLSWNNKNTKVLYICYREITAQCSSFSLSHHQTALYLQESTLYNNASNSEILWRIILVALL